jgi:hypothetical protein
VPLIVHWGLVNNWAEDPVLWVFAFSLSPSSLAICRDFMRVGENNCGERGRQFMAAADYRIEPDGLVIVFLSERSTQRTPPSSARIQIGARMAFKTKHDTAQFVRAGEREGFKFEGKEFIAGY